MQNTETGELRKLTGQLVKERPAAAARLLGFPPDSPVFCEGEVLCIKGGYWRVLKLWRGRMKLKSISAAEARKAVAVP